MEYSQRSLLLLPLLLLHLLLLLPPTISVTPLKNNNDKPILAIIPAAWHSPIHYSSYIDQLRSRGYTSVSERLPSCDSPNPKAQSVSTDAAFIRQRLLRPAIEAGKEIVVIMHSYSGGPGSVAAKGLSVDDRRAEGKEGGVIGLIYISAFVAQQGQTLVSGSGGRLAPWVVEHPNGQMSVVNAAHIFYNDVPPALAELAISNLRDQARSTAFTPCGAPAWADPFYANRLAYARTSLDNAIPVEAQDAMLQASGVRWEIQTFRTGHAPFLSQPRQLGLWTDRQVERFRRGMEEEGEVSTA
ncbi:MAG: hypothetical protein Q9180_000404 [Flavoplaca navasiana]